MSRKRSLGRITPTMEKAFRLARKKCDGPYMDDSFQGGACKTGVRFAVERADQTGGPILAPQIAADDCVDWAMRNGGSTRTVETRALTCVQGISLFFKSMKRLSR